MSTPAPEIVQVLPLKDWLPATAGLPMSVQVQPVGQGGATGAGTRVTLEKVAASTALALKELTAVPARMLLDMVMATPDPATSDQEMPSMEV